MTIRVWASAQIGPTGRKLKQILDRFPGNHSFYYVTSGYRPGDPGHHGGLVYGGSPTAALDVGFNYGSPGYQGRARALGEWLYRFRADTVELILSRVGSSHANGGFYVKNQRAVGPYAHTGSNTSVRHEDHVHFATSSALADRILRGLTGTPAPAPSSPSTVTIPANVNPVSVTPWYSRPTLRQGANQAALRDARAHLQFLLRSRLKYTIDSFSDAPFGPQTQRAVVDFQRKYGHLANDGIVGPQTWAQLEVAAAQAISHSGRPVLRLGASGGWVGYLAHALRKGGASIDHVVGFPFGPQTDRAVRAFQGKYSWLQNDGVVGPNTWAAIDAVERGQTPRNPNQGGGTTAPVTPPPSKYDSTRKPIFGWDASDFDHGRGMRASHISAAKREGIRFFTHKATEMAGASQWTHVQCGPKLRAARDAGIPFLGAYVVPRSAGTVKQQVDFLLSFADREFGWWKNFDGWFWQVDLEHWSYDKVPVSVGTAMCSELERRTGKKVILYAPRWAYGNTIPSPWNRVLWNSHYVSGTRNFRELYPGPNHGGWATMSGHRPVILQYSDRAIIGGQHTCDANAFEGSEQDFAKLIRA